MVTVHYVYHKLLTVVCCKPSSDRWLMLVILTTILYKYSSLERSGRVQSVDLLGRWLRNKTISEY